MPFGYWNGPALFQRVIQEILAPFLWIFTLVYIDEIVIFSKSFDDHLNHLELVLKAIKDAKITLSPGMCHFAYQSLMLLGQKVSWLGLSTHKEKVDTIISLDNPRNVNDLQVFLGMMVYFSSSIPSMHGSSICYFSYWSEKISGNGKRRNRTYTISAIKS